ncbi:hypothetical protein Q1695_014021 [Nippostrongylus brasiliensis]|nr:hypothetical protein Q1695_014021 [Nippostrongylus brasiliensis]
MMISRVKVLLQSPRRKERMAHFRKRERIIRQQFTPSSPLFLGDDVVVVDNSMKPSTSERSVEVARSEPSASGKQCDNKRNRLFDPLSAIASRLLNEHSSGRFHQAHSDEEAGSSTSASVVNEQDVHMQTMKEDREVLYCSNGPSAPSSRKPATMKPREQRLAQQGSNDFPKKSMDIVIRRDFQDTRVVNHPGKRKPEPTKAPEADETTPHVHKSETLTVIIPRKKAALVPQEMVRVIDTMQRLKSTTALQAVSDDELDDDCEKEEQSVCQIIKTVSGEKLAVYSPESSFSNMYKCRRLIIHEQKFSSTEQFYVWTKAVFCKDLNAANAILCLTDSRMIKGLGAGLDQLKSFDVDHWRKFSWKVRMKAAMAKFKQNRRLRYQLFRTIGATLVEANPDDKYWGVGLSLDDEHIRDPSKWPGSNVMGEVLVQIRDVLEEVPEYAEEVSRARQNLFVS